MPQDLKEEEGAEGLFDRTVSSRGRALVRWYTATNSLGLRDLVFVLAAQCAFRYSDD